jgi:hypothetical protein
VLSKYRVRVYEDEEKASNMAVATSISFEHCSACH